MKSILPFALLAAALVPTALHATIPDAIPYHGRVSVNGTNYSGNAEMKFAIYHMEPGDTFNAMVLWSNDGATPGVLSEPTRSVSTTVNMGNCDLGLGDTTIPNMAPLPERLTWFPANSHVYLRVWFNDGTHGFQALSPDTELRSVPYAREAGSLAGVSTSRLAQTDQANIFRNVNGLTVSGDGPSGNTTAYGTALGIAGPGTRMEFVPGYAAFRAGSVDGTQWDAGNIGLYSAAMGQGTTASAKWSSALGYGTQATNDCSTALGDHTQATKWGATAMGWKTTASGDIATAMGANTLASGLHSTAMGADTKAVGDRSTAMGQGTTASGEYSTALGRGTRAASQSETVIGQYNILYIPTNATGWSVSDPLFVVGNGNSDTTRSDALVIKKSGETTINSVNGLTVNGSGPVWDANNSKYIPASGASVPISGAGTRMEFIPGYAAFRAGTAWGDQWGSAKMGLWSTAIGNNTTASGDFSIAMGNENTASGKHSIAIGNGTTASGLHSTAMGTKTKATGDYSTAMGESTTASGNASTAMGFYTTASASGSTAMGAKTNATGSYSTAMGHQTEASGLYSTAMGASTTASGQNSTVMGWYTIASGLNSTAMGHRSEASGQYSTVMGYNTRAPGPNSTAMGYSTSAAGVSSTAMGSGTSASGDYSTAMGYATFASGESSTAMGLSTDARSYVETALGCFNSPYTPASTTSWSGSDRLLVVGNGTDAYHRSDAFIINKRGDAWLAGALWQASDRNKKTNIVAVDTAAVLAGVAGLPISTWRYKNDTVTHLGPMAQEFAAAFHLGGTETSIASVDADGVALASIQELKKQLDAKEARLTKVEAQNALLLEDSAAKDSKISALEARLAALEAKLGK
jgi:hypothetical protein